MATFPSKVNYATGDILTATNMNDVGGAINLLDGAQFAAGKNKIINGDFGIWQRGTSFSNPAAGDFNADRWLVSVNGTGVTRTISQQTFTPGTAPVAGYESQYFLRYAVSVIGTATANNLIQKIEDVRTYAGQTVTLSFWAKAATGFTMPSPVIGQNFGSGGSGSVYTSVTMNSTSIGTSWARYTGTVTVPSISGKTIGTGSNLELTIQGLGAGTFTLDLWGVQLENAQTASNFQTATGTKQGELAACQRYYWRSTGVEGNGRIAGLGIAASSTSVLFAPAIPTSMRTYPSSVDYSTLCIYDGVTVTAISSLTLQSGAGSLNSTSINATVTGATTYRPYFLATNNQTAGYIGFSAEL
jgi:hypothetical protein